MMCAHPASPEPGFSPPAPRSKTAGAGAVLEAGLGPGHRPSDWAELGWHFTVAAALLAEQPREGWSQSARSLKSWPAFPVVLRVVEKCEHVLRAARLVGDGPLAPARADPQGADLRPLQHLCLWGCAEEGAGGSPWDPPIRARGLSVHGDFCQEVFL